LAAICEGVIHNLWSNGSFPIRDQFDDEFSFGSDSFQCVIAHLPDKYAGDVHTHGVVAITRARQFGGDYALKNAADLTSQSGFFHAMHRIDGFATISRTSKSHRHMTSFDRTAVFGAIC
jgi:hypothetical protein